MHTEKILVTGGAGFIGSAVIRHIIQNTNDQVCNVDKLTYASNLENLHKVDKTDRYSFERSICNRDELKRVFSQFQPDTIMHLAAESHVDRSIDDPSTFIKTNIVGTYTLEVACSYWQKLNDSPKHFAFITLALMKFTAIFRIQTRWITHRNIYLLKKLHMRLVAHTLLAKLVQII